MEEKAAALAVSESQQRERRALLDSILNSMADGVVMADCEGRFTLFNPAAEQILGLGPADIPPSEWPKYYQAYQSDQATLYPVEDLPMVRALRGETTNNVVIRIRRGQTAKFASINASGRPIYDDKGQPSGGLVVFHDITELVEANGELESFTYSVSHDLRAPLRHLDGFSRILEEEYGAELPEEARHYLHRIRSATTHMSRLVEDLLGLSRLGRQGLQLRTVTLRELVEEARAEVLSEAEGRVIDWQIGALPEVQADVGLFRQVWINLFSNAIKFTRNQPRPVIQVGSRKENGEAILFVRDNGAGFDPRYADKLFGVFQRLHRQDEFEGTGVGLATVQRIVHKHGGRVWAESQPGQGATFYFSVPARASVPRQPKAEMGVSA